MFDAATVTRQTEPSLAVQSRLTSGSGLLCRKAVSLSTRIARTKPNVLHVEIGLDELIGPGNGYPNYLRGSHKMKELPIDPIERNAITEPIQLAEGDVIIRNGQTRVQGTGIENANACSMLVQFEWGPEVKWWQEK